jgi:hypothetical protein
VYGACDGRLISRWQWKKHEAIYGDLHCRLIISSWQQEKT